MSPLVLLLLTASVCFSLPTASSGVETLAFPRADAGWGAAFPDFARVAPLSAPPTAYDAPPQQVFPTATLTSVRRARPAVSPGLPTALLMEEARVPSKWLSLSLPALPSLSLPSMNDIKLEHVVWTTWLVSVAILTTICYLCFEWTLYLV